MDICYYVFGLLFFSIDFVYSGLHEKRLLKYLFDPTRPDAHNPMERPAEIDSQRLTVSVKFYLNQVMDVDEKNQVLTTILWLDMTWDDYHFKWNPHEYGNITVINLPYTAVWRPDILLYNCADEKFDRTFPTNTIMQHTGNVQWMPPGLFKSTCNIDILWFPFDEQNCVLKFGTWSYNGDQVDFRLQCIDSTETDCSINGTVDLSEYSPNGEFHLKSASVRRFAQRYECCDYDFIDIKMNIRLQRRALYYVFNLIVPCLLISGMSLMVFMLPPDAGEKISLGVTILLSLTMFLQLVADKLPQTSEAIPLIGIYFSCTMVMCSLSIVFTVLVLNYHHRSADVVAVPAWIRTLVNSYLARLMFMEAPNRSRIVVEEDAESENSDSHLLKQENFKDTMHIVHEESNGIPGSRNQTPGNIGWNIENINAVSPSKIDPAQSRRRRWREAGVVGNGKTFPTYKEMPLPGVHMLPERSSRSLLANVLDIEDDFRVAALSASPPAYPVDNIGVGSYNRTLNLDSDLPNHLSEQNGLRKDNWPPDNLSLLSDNQQSDDSLAEPVKSPLSTALLRTYRTDLEQIVTELRFITSKMRDDEKEALVSLEWKFAARVIDRFCLIVFGIFNLLATAVILFSAPNLVASFQTEDSRVSAGLSPLRQGA
uniref:Nicotinic acetylcholine receptor alpha subunit-2 n=1 Tax=Cryptocotyle lingua TaxID=66766 RepID=A0A7U0TJ53_9TREM|nr:nicotinic acetylcholine receptor alpha subunit-2 [Cryptocotyle lingua]